MYKKYILIIFSLLIIICSVSLKPRRTNAETTTTPALVTFISDDGWSKDFTDLKPLSDKYDIPFTSAIVARYIGMSPFMSLEQLKILNSTGRWEFISHTVTHPDLTQLSEEQLDEELRLNKEWLISNNLGNGYQYFAYPAGKYNDKVLDTTMSYYKLGFTYQPEEGLNSTQMDPSRVKRITLGAFAEPGKNTVAYYNSKVDEAIANNQWLVFTLHSGIQGHNNADLEAVIQYIKSKNVPIVTVNKAMEFYKPSAYPNPGVIKRIEENNPNINYSGAWTSENGSNFSGGSDIYTESAGNSASFLFTGTGISVISATYYGAGIAKITLDGTVYYVDEYISGVEWNRTIFKKSGLANGVHSIKFECSGNKNPSSSSKAVLLDAFDIINGDIQTSTVTKRIEENNPNITYNGSWTNDSSSSLSSGTGVYSGSAGSSASFSFTGTGINMIATSSNEAGIAKITLDGTVYYADEYAASTQWQKAVFQKTDLASGTHNIKIEYSGTKNQASFSNNIFIDAFDIMNGDIQPVQPSTVTTRIEENNPKIIYNGDWASQNITYLSGGTDTYTGSAGSYASFSFTGTGIKMISTLYYGAGIAKITLDGTDYYVDEYSPSIQWQRVVFQKTDLASGTHNIKIEWSGTKNPESSSNNIFIDAFDIINGDIQTSAVTKRIEENNPNIIYEGSWISDSNANLSSGSGKYSGSVGSSASFSFTGTGINMIATSSNEAGIAKITLDGTVYSADEYAASTLWQKAVFQKTDLASGTHSIKIEYSGTKNPASASNNIFIDAFDIINGDILTVNAIKRIEENNPKIIYSGTWTSQSSTKFSGGTDVYSGSAGSSASFSFTGTGIKMISTPYRAAGIAKITLDGTVYNVDLYSSTTQWQKVVFQKMDLASGTHNIIIEYSGTKNKRSSSTNIFIDAFDIVNGDIQ
jgi:peptidoglycan/xylan/chitin deacetylase (PgdA/CDA1 family)